VRYLFPVLFHSFLVNTFMKTATVPLVPSHMPRYQASTTLTFFVFNLPLTKSSDQRKTASHAERR